MVQILSPFFSLIAARITSTAGVRVSLLGDGFFLTLVALITTPIFAANLRNN
jgi:hypothetical protein